MTATTYYVCQFDSNTWIALTYKGGTVVRRILSDLVGCQDGVAAFRQRNPELDVLAADYDTARWARTIWKARQTPDIGWSVIHGKT